ncbi:MAG TPA: hypothetical protein VKT77_00510 [Chthonomonadaceae bacterium]|nr:hypothetical protein [Chthonomonadaceae bacterium]
MGVERGMIGIALGVVSGIAVMAGCAPSARDTAQTAPPAPAAAPPAPPKRDLHQIAISRASLGFSYLDGDVDEAVTCFRDAHELEPANRDFTLNYALALKSAGRVREAIPLWKSLQAGNDDAGRTSRKLLVIYRVPAKGTRARKPRRSAAE